MLQVLLADDEPIFLEFMEQILDWRSFGCEICARTRDGRMALEEMEKKRPDIAFIDINMPLADGIEVCKEVRKKHIPSRLVIVTGHDEFSFAYQAIKIGVDDYLLKPFTREELAETVQKLVSGRRAPAGFTGGEQIEAMGEGKTKYEIMAHAIEEYLGQNYRNPSVSLAMISAAMGFEESYLRRVYKAATGMTIMQKLEEIRLSRAMKYLDAGDCRIQEIAKLVGFSDLFYFSRRFKQYSKMTPSEYRQRKRKN